MDLISLETVFTHSATGYKEPRIDEGCVGQKKTTLLQNYGKRVSDDKQPPKQRQDEKPY